MTLLTADLPGRLPDKGRLPEKHCRRLVRRSVLSARIGHCFQLARKNRVGATASSSSARPLRPGPLFQRKSSQMLTNILIVILVLMLIGALPNWSHSASWGYLPSGGLGILLIIVIVLLLTGRL